MAKRKKWIGNKKKSHSKKTKKRLAIKYEMLKKKSMKKSRKNVDKIDKLKIINSTILK